MKPEHYKRICNELAKCSNCLSRQIGVVITTPDGSIISTGYNGPPRGFPHCDRRHNWDSKFLIACTHKNINVHYYVQKDKLRICPRQILGFKSGEGLEFCTAAHAETNAIVNAARVGVSTNGCIMYMNCGMVCKECAKLIINSGIKIIYKIGSNGSYDDYGSILLEKSGVEVREY